MAYFRAWILAAAFALALLASQCDSASLDKRSTVVAANRLKDSLKHTLPVHATNAGRRRSLLSTSQHTRSLLQGSGETTCVWDAYSGTCELSDAALANRLSVSNSDFANFVTEFPACESMSTKKDCKATKICTWEKEHKQCHFVKFTKGRKNSPCYKAAPGNIDSIVASGLCPTFTSKYRCDNNRLCVWNETSLPECGFDAFQIFYGFSQNELGGAVEEMADPWAEEFIEAYNFGNPYFDSDQVLGWMPEQTCPEDTDKKVCDFIEIAFVPYLASLYYCVLKYSDSFQSTACSADPLCHYDLWEGLCLSATYSDRASAAFALEESVPLIENELDREVFGAEFRCAEITKSENCTGICMMFGDECGVDTKWAYGQIAAVDEGGDDALCTYMSALAETGCQNFGPYDHNVDLESCEWRSLDEQRLPSLDYLVDVAFESDESLKSFREECTKQTTRGRCFGVAA